MIEKRCARMKTEIKSLFFLPRWTALARALPMMATVTWADRVVLAGLDFRPGFVAADALFERYACMVDALPEWCSR